jgi:hypothetical protein
MNSRDLNSRFGLADDDELNGFDIMDAAIASSAKKYAAASSSLFQQAVAPSSQNSNANGLPATILFFIHCYCHRDHT